MIIANRISERKYETVAYPRIAILMKTSALGPS